MKLKKFGFSQAKRLKIHYERSKDDDGTIKDTSYSKINPAKSHLNYNLCEGDLVELLEEKKKTAYIRSDKTDVAFLDLVVPYPKDCSVDSKKYFKAMYDILTHEKKLKHCIGAFVHMDESNPHMHYICMPIEECPEFQKSKDLRVFDPAKNKEVTRRVRTKFTEKFNAKKLYGKEFFNNLHPYMQKKINDRGITGTVITPERVNFNKWKKERINYYNELIKKEPNKKMDFINQFWEEYQSMNPKKYKDDRPKDKRLDDFNEMLEAYKKEVQEENASEFLKIDEDAKNEVDLYRKNVIKDIEEYKKAVSEAQDKALDRIEDNAKKVIESKKADVKAREEILSKKSNLLTTQEQDLDDKMALVKKLKQSVDKEELYLKKKMEETAKLKEEAIAQYEYIKENLMHNESIAAKFARIEIMLENGKINERKAVEQLKNDSLDDLISRFKDERSKEYAPKLNEIANKYGYGDDAR